MALLLSGISSPNPIFFSSKCIYFPIIQTQVSIPSSLKNKLEWSPLLQELSIQAEDSFAIEDGFYYWVLVDTISGVPAN